MTKYLLVLLAACGSSAPGASTGSATTSPPPVPEAVVKGKVESRTFHSAALDVDKTYWVYLPAGYDETKKWPVFYYLHGLTGNEENWLHGGHIDEAADKLGLQAIIVMPDGDDGFYVDSPKQVDYAKCIADGTGLFLQGKQPPAKTCVKHWSYETYITKDLVADVDGHYHTNATREGRGIAGLSMGGLGAWMLGLRHPDLYAAAASHSGFLGLIYKGPHPWKPGSKVEFSSFNEAPRGNPMVDWVVGIFGKDIAFWNARDPEQLIEKVENGKPALYLDAGTEDEFAFEDVAGYIHERLTERHIDHVFFTGPGGHNFQFWAPREVESLKFLREHVAKP